MLVHKSIFLVFIDFNFIDEIKILLEKALNLSSFYELLAICSKKGLEIVKEFKVIEL